MVDGCPEVISKPEFLEVSYTDFQSRVSLINNIINEGKLEPLTEFDVLSTEANANLKERLINQEFDEIITANNDRKMISLSKNTSNKAKFDEMKYWGNIDVVLKYWSIDEMTKY